jgi:hypothetical protein
LAAIAIAGELLMLLFQISSFQAPSKFEFPIALSDSTDFHGIEKRSQLGWIRFCML